MKREVKTIYNKNEFIKFLTMLGLMVCLAVIWYFATREEFEELPSPSNYFLYGTVCLLGVCCIGGIIYNTRVVKITDKAVEISMFGFLFTKRFEKKNIKDVAVRMMRGRFIITFFDLPYSYMPANDVGSNPGRKRKKITISLSMEQKGQVDRLWGHDITTIPDVLSFI